MERARTTPALGRHGAAALVLVAVVAACGDDGALRDGVYTFELSEARVIRSGVPPREIPSASGVHEVTLDRGSMVDRWRAADGRAGTCSGVFALEGRRAAFRWTEGCAGDWAVTYALDGDRVTWSSVEVLDPGAGAQAQRLAELFNGVPWTRTGDVADAGD